MQGEHQAPQRSAFHFASTGYGRTVSITPSHRATMSEQWLPHTALYITLSKR